MPTSASPRTIAVVGAGAAGTLTAVQLLRTADLRAVPCEVLLIDPARVAGPGLAYSTSDARHLLNVPAGRMSAFPDQPGHFTGWLDRELPGRYDARSYVPRAVYGRYLARVLSEAASAARYGRLRFVRERVTGLRRSDEGVQVELGPGWSLTARAVVLALGAAPAGCAWAPEALRGSGRLVADPWAPGALAALPKDGDLLLVGTGLTMADTALTLAAPGRVVHAVSRTGLVPDRHRTATAPAVVPPDLDGLSGLDEVRRAVLRHIGACRRLYGDWRTGMDGLRSVTPELWQRLPAADRDRFLREDLRVWETHRHRLAPATATALDGLRAGGLLETGRAEVVAAAEVEGAVEVGLSDGRTLRVRAVVNCTGPGTAAAPLVRGLLARGTARPGPCGLGLDTAADGRLLPVDPGTPLWALGALRRGNLFESTAVPEIRGQAAQVAAAVFAAAVFAAAVFAAAVFEAVPAAGVSEAVPAGGPSPTPFSFATEVRDAAAQHR